MQPSTPSRDRFIANRSAIDIDVARYSMNESVTVQENREEKDDQMMMTQIASPSKVLHFIYFYCMIYIIRSSDILQLIVKC